MIVQDKEKTTATRPLLDIYSEMIVMVHSLLYRTSVDASIPYEEAKELFLDGLEEAERLASKNLKEIKCQLK